MIYSLSSLSSPINGEWFGKAQDIAREFFDDISGLDRVDVYHLAMSKFVHLSNEKRVLIFSGSSNEDRKVDLPDGTTINGYANLFDKLMMPPTDDSYEHIASNEGLVIASFSLKHNVGYIHIDLLNYYSAERESIMRFIFDKFAGFARQKANLSSWKHTSRKDVLVSSITDQFKKKAEKDRIDAERKLGSVREEILNYQRSLGNLYRKREKLMRDLVSETKHSEEAVAKFVGDMDLIGGLEKVKDLRYENDKVVVTTSDLIIYEPVKNKHYIGGSFRIEIDMFNTKINFFGGVDGKGRKGYWTNNDPHPHVDGDGGYPCLGSLSETIMELSAQGEIYALVLMAIDFLESVNIDDPAGSKIHNWDECDESGKLVMEAEEVFTCGYSGDEVSESETFICAYCDDRIHNRHERRAYRVDDNGDIVEQDLSICPSCAGDLEFDDDIEEYIILPN